MMAATFEVPRGEKNPPTAMITSFTNGRLSLDKPDSRIRFNCYQSTGKNIKSKNKRMLVAETNDMNYIGHSTDTADIGSVRYLLVARDPKTHRARVVDAEMYQLQPTLKRAAEDSEDEDFSQMSYIEKNDLLTGAFGSSKKQRAMASRKKNKIEGDVLDSAVSTAVDKALSMPDANTTLTPIKKEEVASSIPPHNKDATDPSQVYSLSDIVSPHLMECMVNPARVFVDSTIEIRRDWKEKEMYSQYVISHVAILPVEAEARRNKACYLMYLHYMIVMYRLGFKDFRKRDPLPEEWPDMVKKFMLKKFCISSLLPSGKFAYARPSRMKDTLLSYILVLALILDQWKLDIGVIQKDLKLGLTSLANHFRALGCKVTTSKTKSSSGHALNITIAELIVPLTFPEQREKGKKERR